MLLHHKQTTSELSLLSEKSHRRYTLGLKPSAGLKVGAQAW